MQAPPPAGPAPRDSQTLPVTSLEPRDPHPTQLLHVLTLHLPPCSENRSLKPHHTCHLAVGVTRPKSHVHPHPRKTCVSSYANCIIEGFVWPINSSPDNLLLGSFQQILSRLINHLRKRRVSSVTRTGACTPVPGKGQKRPLPHN